MVDGIGVLGAEHLIPFKMYAWINLLERKRAGEHVNEKDLKKHKYDVFRLLQIVTAGTKVESEGLVTESIHRYIEEISVMMGIITVIREVCRWLIKLKIKRVKENLKKAMMLERWIFKFVWMDFQL